MNNEPSLFENTIEDEKILKEYNASPLENILSQVEISGLSVLGTPQEMKKKLEKNLAIHQAIVDFVNEHFIEGIDYGPAVAQSKKPVLLQPGAEKIVYAFDTTPKVINDYETWRMFGSPTNTAFYLCLITDNATNKIIGYGRGACSEKEKFGLQAEQNKNGAIKMAQKRALVDAAKTTFKLSERFTQDLGEVKSFVEIKKMLYKNVMDYRAGVKSDLTDNQFISKVCEREIHKKSISTLNELRIIAEKYTQYDYATGERTGGNNN